MQALKQRLQVESASRRYEAPLRARNILKVDSFLNHQVDPELMMEVGRELAQRLGSQKPTKVLTLETSGIIPAFTTAVALHIPVVIARKRRAPGMPRELLKESTLSSSDKQIIDLYASPEFITPADRVVIVDAFMTTGQTLLALARLAQNGGAQVVGIGTVIEKTSEGGRQNLSRLNVPIHALVRIEKIEGGQIYFAE